MLASIKLILCQILPIITNIVIQGLLLGRFDLFISTRIAAVAFRVTKDARPATYTPLSIALCSALTTHKTLPIS